MSGELSLRLGCFLSVLAIMVVWEWRRPNRRSPVSLKTRWSSNFLLLFCGSLIARLLVPAGLVSVAYLAQRNHFGLWNQLEVSMWLIVPGSLLALDCLIYWQHRLFHHVPLLWRVHRVHHADPHLDASTGLRFHPLEIALSLVIKIAAIGLLGIPAVAVIMFEILLNATSIFNHSNIKLPAKIEWPLRAVLVTQAMHRIHHSQEVAETNSNFSFNLSCWDRLFHSYRANAVAGDEGIKLGLKQYASAASNSRLLALLLMPFHNKTAQGLVTKPDPQDGR